MGCACSACCFGCLVSDPVGDELAAHAIAGMGELATSPNQAQIAGMGELATSPNQAQIEKDRVNAIALSVDVVMRSCYPAGSVQRAQWDATMAAWRTFYAADLGFFSGSFFGSGGVVDAAREFETRIVAFQKQAAADGCKVGALVEPKDERNRQDSESMTSAVKFVAVAAVAVAGVIAIKSLI